ncbi:MAG: hypothetical protein JNL62_00680 [Bryobacterales bacterium]|nr:hypothetical protein [Bryobacterales bacterium]
MQSGKPGVRLGMLEPALMRLWMDAERDTGLGVQERTHWKMHLTPPLPSAWPLTRSGGNGQWIRYAWAVGPGGVASEPFAKITFEPGDELAVVFAFTTRSAKGGHRLALPGTMNGAWVLDESEQRRATDFLLRRVFQDNDPEAILFARMWRGWLWSNREVEGFLEKNHGPFVHWLRAAAPPK